MCADLVLHSKDLVLSISLDFPEPIQDESDGRIIGELDGVVAPLVAISVPNRAYVGWFTELLPSLAGTTTEQEFRERATPHYLRAARGQEPHWYVIEEEGKDCAQFQNVEDLYSRLEEMIRRPLVGAINFYEEMCHRKANACKLMESKEI